MSNRNSRIARFTPDPPPDNAEELPTYLKYMMELIGGMLNSPTRNFAPLKKEPPKPVDGDVAFADGIVWDPSEGRGLYYFDTGVWIKI